MMRPGGLGLLLVLTTTAGCLDPDYGSPSQDADDRVVPIMTPVAWNITTGVGTASLLVHLLAAPDTTCNAHFTMAGQSGPRGIDGGGLAVQDGQLVDYVYTSDGRYYTAHTPVGNVPQPPPIEEGNPPSYGINWAFNVTGPADLLFFGHGWEFWQVQEYEYGPFGLAIDCTEPTELGLEAGVELLALNGIHFDNGSTTAVTPNFGARVEVIDAMQSFKFQDGNVTLWASSRNSFGPEYAETFTVSTPDDRVTKSRPGDWTLFLEKEAGEFEFSLERQRVAPSTCPPPCLITTEPLLILASSHVPQQSIIDAVRDWVDGTVEDLLSHTSQEPSSSP